VHSQFAIRSGIDDLHDRSAQHSTAQHSTAQHSTAQHSTAQHSTAQHSTAQHIARPAVNVAGRWAVILGEGHNPGALVSSLADNAELCIFNLLQLLEVFSQSRIQDVPFPPQIVEADSLYFSAYSHHNSTSISAGEQHQTVHVCHQVSLPQKKKTQISAGSIGTMQVDSGTWCTRYVLNHAYAIVSIRPCNLLAHTLASMLVDCASRQECTTKSQYRPGVIIHHHPANVCLVTESNHLLLFCCDGIHLHQPRLRSSSGSTVMHGSLAKACAASSSAQLSL